MRSPAKSNARRCSRWRTASTGSSTPESDRQRILVRREAAAEPRHETHATFSP
jgi:hypothetical protein